LNIPNAHIHGGERSKGGIDEYTRHAITKISNIHFAATKKSRDRIIKMGENPKYVFFTGSPGIDQVINGPITSKNDLEIKFNMKFNDKPILLVQHPVTTQSTSSKKQIIATFSTLKKLDKTIIAIGPNSDTGNKQIFQQIKKFQRTHPNVKFFENINRQDYLGLLNSCELLIGNSSSGVIEAGYFKIPVIDIGIRQEGRESNNNVIHVRRFEEKGIIMKAVKKAIKMRNNSQLIKTRIYGNGNSSDLIVKHLEKIKITREMIEKQIFY
jgi:UDP-N-acetylglucosamine 2-epimerase (non-hydrolysing)/GDP/UDP-N,N'-diacetylbacillosamine 2-epimerase (hydrolysing)